MKLVGKEPDTNLYDIVRFPEGSKFHFSAPHKDGDHKLIKQEENVDMVIKGYRIPFTRFFMAVLKYFRVHITQLSPFDAARVSHFEVLKRVPELSHSVTLFRAFYTRTYSDGLFSFAKHMGLLDIIKIADPRKVRAVEVQKGDDQVTLLEKLVDPSEDTVVVRRGEEEVVTEQPKKIKKKRLIKQSDVLPAKKLRTGHPSLASGTGESESFVDLSGQASLQIRTTMRSSSTLSAPVDTAAATITSTKAKLAADVNLDLAGPSQLEESEGSDDSFYELTTFDPSEAKRWYVPRWNITNDSLLDDGFSCRTLVERVAPPAFFSSLCSIDCDQLYTEFNVGATRQICLGSEVRSRAEHELELREKLNAKYGARGKLLVEKDSEILRLKSQLAEKEAEAAEVIRLRDQVSS
ncbi:hypothetical protein Tco_0415528 [Tanacetum coccineum]